MWVIKEQTKKSPSGIRISPVLETQSGAEEMLKLLRQEDQKRVDAVENPKHFFIAQYIARAKK